MIKMFRMHSVIKKISNCPLFIHTRKNTILTSKVFLKGSHLYVKELNTVKSKLIYQKDNIDSWTVFQEC